MGAANKVSGNKITGIKVLKKIYPKKKNKKKVQSLVKMRPSLRRLHKRDILCIFILNIARDVLNINRPCFCMVVNILCSHAFFTMIELFFERRFCINHTGLEPEKKSLITITVQVKRHIRLFTDCHVSLDTLYVYLHMRKNNKPEAEFKEFEPRLKFAKTRVILSTGLNLVTFDTILSGTNHI